MEILTLLFAMITFTLMASDPRPELSATQKTVSQSKQHRS
ncbi:ABZJ_00068 family colistin stress protein [Acinetobacter gerneri]|nr:hypothetical protein L289_1230 [Acinetobacter gerneri DSM 14967 = CIP 107464 = MTCC 9824]